MIVHITLDVLDSDRISCLDGITNLRDDYMI